MPDAAHIHPGLHKVNPSLTRDGWRSRHFGSGLCSTQILKEKIQMTSMITDSSIISLERRLENHPLYSEIKTQQGLSCFMEHHVFSIWDQMSLVKYLQGLISPSSYPWVPRCNTTLQRYVNELVLKEESDKGIKEGDYFSHFELYQQAMQDIGANVEVSRNFVDTVTMRGINAALQSMQVPVITKCFHTIIFDIINTDQPHLVAAALVFGHDHLIPNMFRSAIKLTGISEQHAPTLYHYLNRHTPAHESYRRTLSLQILNRLCIDDEKNLNEALETAKKVMAARIQFYDSLHAAIKLTQNIMQNSPKMGEGQRCFIQ
jgi:hypothetical protein